MTIQSFRPLLCSGIGLLLIALAAGEATAVNTGQCNPMRVKFITSSLADSATTSSAFVDIPQATIAFRQGGQNASCVLVRFSASTYGDFAVDQISIRAFLDNTTAARPAFFAVRGEEDPAGHPHTFEFVFPHVVPGAHTIRMQYSSAKGNPVHVKEHNTVIQFTL